jgi:hypothetical protein
LVKPNIEKYQLDYSIYNPEKIAVKEEDLQWSPRIAVYQVVTGNYDDVYDAYPLDRGIYDFYLITDRDISPLYKGWKKYGIPPSIRELKNPVLINRYLKMHPGELFPEYDYTVYLDGNIQIVSDIRPMVRQVSKETGLAMHRHFMRDCVYLEKDICLKFKKGIKTELLKQTARYQNDGFPEHWGLFNASVIVTDLRNENQKNIFSWWWDEFLRSGSLRDQIALPYVLWSHGYPVDSIGNFGTLVYENPKLRVYGHQ